MRYVTNECKAHRPFVQHSNREHNATRSRTQQCIRVVTVTTLIFFRAMISMAGHLMWGVSVFTVAFWWHDCHVWPETSSRMKYFWEMLCFKLNKQYELFQRKYTVQLMYKVQDRSLPPSTVLLKYFYSSICSMQWNWYCNSYLILRWESTWRDYLYLIIPFSEHICHCESRVKEEPGRKMYMFAWTRCYFSKEIASDEQKSFLIDYIVHITAFQLNECINCVSRFSDIINVDKSRWFLEI